jgi:cytochrome c oxidase subunit II
LCAVAGGGLWLAGTSGAHAAAGAARRVPMRLSKFVFEPPEIRARAGETLTLMLTSADFVHGFALPELNARADVPPGRTVELTLPALPEGAFTMLCDNFCGEGHDKMSGLLRVGPRK